MSEKELLCAALDNTSIKQEEENLGNSNPTYGVPEQFCEAYSVKNGDEASVNLGPAERGIQINSKKETYDEKVMTGSYGAISLEQELSKNDSHGSKDLPLSESADGDINPSVKQKEQNSNSSSKHFTSIENDGIQKLEDNQEDSEQEDYDEDVMTGSYGEISLDREFLNCDKNSDSLSSREDERCFLDESRGDTTNDEVREKKRPDSLILMHNTVTSKPDDFVPLNQIPQHVHQGQQTSDGRTTSADVSPSFSSDEFAVHSGGRVRTGSDTSGLSELQGTLTVDGDIVTFVAEDLQAKIKMSSPVSRWTDSSSFPGSRSSTPSLYRQALQPNLHIDQNILTDLETHAKKVSTCVDTMLENLSGTLQSISSLTVDCMETYESSVCKTCDAVDVNIKAVYQLMAKCEELSNSMGPLYRLSGDVKHIKKMLEQLEHIVEHKS